jgi:hypothetical protein
MLVNLPYLLKAFSFDFQNNFFDDSFPSDIPAALLPFECETMYVYLSVNSFEGSLPEWLCSCSFISHFYLIENSFSGIPCFLTKLPQLEFVYLDRNYFNGDLNVIFNQNSFFPLISELSFADNLFTGSFPSFLFSLPRIGFYLLVKTFSLVAFQMISALQFPIQPLR